MKYLKYFPIIGFIALFTGMLIGQSLTSLNSISALPSKAEEQLARHYESAFRTVKFKEESSPGFTLNSLSEKVIILNFWASWCLPCLTEFPSLSKLKARLPNDVLVLGVNSDFEGQADLTRFTKKQAINFRNVLDPEGEIYAQFKVSKIPFSVVFFKGKVLEIVKGEKDFDSEEFYESLKSRL